MTKEDVEGGIPLVNSQAVKDPVSHQSGLLASVSQIPSGQYSWHSHLIYNKKDAMSY